MRGGRLGMLGVVIEGVGWGRTKRGAWCGIGVWAVVRCGKGSSCSVVGRGGVLVGEEDGVEEIVIASGGFGRRRLLVGCTGSADRVDASSACCSSS